jgi:hypothetical protein
LFLRSVRQARPTAKLMERDLIGAVMATSDPTLRAVFAEDSAALIGLAIAAVGLGAHQLTGSATPDAIESILVGVLLAAVATVLIDRNREFLIGEEAPRIRAAALRALLAEPGVARVTCLRLEFVGPRLVSIIGDVDLTGDDAESRTSPSGSARWKRRWTPLQRWPALCSACLRRTSLRLLNKPPRRESLVLTYGSSCVVITPQCQVLMLVQRRGSRFGVSAGAQQAMLDRNQVRDVVGIGGARATAPSLPEAPTSIWAGLQRG